MNTLLKRLFGFLFPGIEGDGADPDGGDPDADHDADPSGNDPDGGAGPDDDEFDIDFVEAPAPRAAARQQGNNDRLARIEESIAEARRVAEERMRTPATPPADAEFQREEERLRAADITEQERWQINANRVLRENQRMANQALFQAHDLQDRTLFESKSATDPRRAKYRDRVEQAVQEERRQGRNASREAVYFYMLGKDIADGKLKPRARAKTPAAEVPRGRTPNARSDVSARGARTEHEKRRARLENLNI